MSDKIVILGAGQAAAQAVTSLRAEGFSGAITVVGDEPFPPYQRPPLSKAYLLGKLERDRLFLKPDQFYVEAGVDLRLGVKATAIDRSAHCVKLSDGSSIAYDRLLLATGTRVRRINVPGADLEGVHYLRSIADVDLLRPALAPGKRLAVIGGGYIGLEVAAVAVKLGLEVTVFEALERLMARAVSPLLSEFYLAEHRAAGVGFHLKTGVDGFIGEGRLRAIRAAGAEYAADLALVGIGVLPNTEIAAAAGLSCDDGIVVDRYCASVDDPAIFAAGDCTRHHGRDGVLLRLECVQNAIDQAKHAALAMIGRPTPYSEVPWFWSDQYDLKMQIAGLARPGDELVQRGDPATRKFAVFHLRKGQVAAVEAVNAAPEYIVGRKLITDGTPVSAERLADTTIPMKQIV
ncbi:MAG: FAD-dependent oxidoreductase [Alphaproteobacteria bacterium]|nr:FAD-dependent oxidoreductase [Alphaproteobacteria bacterium]